MFKRIAAALLVVACLVSSVGCEKGDMLQTYYGYDVFEYVTLGQYKDLTLEVRDPVPTEKEIQEVVDKFLNANKVIIPAQKDTVQKGDFVKITYDGYYLGVKRDGLCETDFELEVGSLTHLEAFEDSLIGRKKGDKYSVNVTYPGDFWNDSLKGQMVTYYITINDLYAKKLPELTDELVYEKLGYNTVENFKTYITEKLTNDNIATAEQSFTANVWNLILENSTVKSYPKERYDFYEEQSLSYIKEYWQQTFPNATFDIFVELMTNQSYEEFMEDVKENCEKVVKDELVLLAIARTEGIVIEWGDYKKGARNYLAQYNCASIADLEKVVARDELCLTVLSGIIDEMICASAKSVTKPN